MKAGTVAFAHPFLRPAVEALLSVFPWLDDTLPEFVVSSPGGSFVRLEIAPGITIRVWIDPDETDVVHLSHELPGRGWHDRFRAADSPDAVGVVSNLIGNILQGKPPEAWAAPVFSLFRHNPGKPKVGIAGGGNAGHGGFVLLSPTGNAFRGLDKDGNPMSTWLPAGDVHALCGIKFLVPAAAPAGLDFSIAGRLKAENPPVITPNSFPPTEIQTEVDKLLESILGPFITVPFNEDPSPTPEKFIQHAETLARQLDPRPDQDGIPFSSVFVTWNGSVCATFQGPGHPIVVPLGTVRLDRKSSQFLKDLADHQRVNYNSQETVVDGGVHFSKDKDDAWAVRTSAHVEWKSGGWSWPGLPDHLKDRALGKG